MKPRTLFLLKRREDYNSDKHSIVGLSTGLYNSAKFIVDMLNDAGQDAQIEVVVDNNCIDRVVTKHHPTHVIIEALWVVPSKFAELIKLHPEITWIVRLHSEMPFMAGEGMAMDWIGDYVSYPQVHIGVNAPRMYDEISTYLRLKGVSQDRVVFLPNFYPQEYAKAKPKAKPKVESDVINIGCFGAVRLLKNHLIQAIGALKFAEKLGLKLRFHINMNRIEMQGDPAMRNLQALFSQISETGHQLVGHEWAPREGFLKICSTMDLGLQVSFSETFNIVGADLISQGVPLIGSSEIPWSCDLFNADPVDSDKIATALERAYHFPKFNVWMNSHNLTKYTDETRKVWLNYLREESHV